MSVIGAGGKSQREPSEQADTLFSKSTAKVLDAICEGEIQGPAKFSYQWIYLDDTPVENPDTTRNFEAQFQFRLGTQNQPEIYGVGDTVESETSVGVTVTNSGGPITRTVVNPDINGVRVTINVPQLVTYGDDGDISGSAFDLEIRVSTDGGTFFQYVYDTIQGKSTGGYQKQYYLRFTFGSTWAIRVTRITPDSTDSKVINEFQWTSYTEVIEQKLKYPNTALVGAFFDAEQFQAIPKRGYLIRGRKIKVPSNMRIIGNGGNSETDNRSYDFPGGSYNWVNPIFGYDGVWDGTFNVAWSHNPAWVLYDLLTNSRFGCGIDESLIDKWTLYKIGQYCDEAVDSGAGYQEPRFSCNAYIQSQEDAYNLINTLSSVFRGQCYYAAGALTFIQDSPGNTVRIFNQSNVVDGKFNYQGVAQRARSTVVLVRWNNPELLWQTDIEVVEDIEGISKYGYNEKDVTAFGCTSRGQAQRIGKWLLAVEMLETETVTFQTGAEGVPVRPGEIIEIGDPNRVSGKKFGRFAQDSVGTTVYLDREIAVVADSTLTLVDGNGQLITRSITNSPGTYDTLVLSGAGIDSSKAAIWIYTPPSDEAWLYRVIGAGQVEPHIFEITATVHKPQKYEIADSVFFGSVTVPRRPTAVVNPPTSVGASVNVSIRGGVRTLNINLGWQPAQYEGRRDEYVTSYEVEIKRGVNGTWEGVIPINGLSFTWTGRSEGEYYTRVRSVDFRGVRSAWVDAPPVSTDSVLTISDFDPTAGLVADTVIITGTNLTGTSAVRFGETDATVFTVDSDTQITVTVPTGASTGPICVQNLSGLACSVNSFTVQVQRPPTLDPAPSTPVAQGDNVILTGTNLDGATQARIGSTIAPFTVLSSTSIQITVPTGTSSAPVTVTTPGGTATTSNNLTIENAGGIPLVVQLDISGTTVFSTLVNDDNEVIFQG